MNRTLRLLPSPNLHINQILERILYIWSIRHPGSGYVQGMNDLLVPFFTVFLTPHIGYLRIVTLELFWITCYLCLDGDIEDIKNFAVGQAFLDIIEVIIILSCKLFWLPFRPTAIGVSPYYWTIFKTTILLPNLEFRNAFRWAICFSLLIKWYMVRFSGSEGFDQSNRCTLARTPNKVKYRLSAFFFSLDELLVDAWGLWTIQISNF